MCFQSESWVNLLNYQNLNLFPGLCRYEQRQMTKQRRETSNKVLSNELPFLSSVYHHDFSHKYDAESWLRQKHLLRLKKS